MARTILGLVDWSDSGKVKFGDPPCDTRIDCIAEDVEGCIEWTGDHAGQVKVIIAQAELAACNDTYYGCVNWATGKFQITIPDNCCVVSCHNSGTYTVTISGCTICGGGDCSDTDSFTYSYSAGNQHHFAGDGDNIGDCDHCLECSGFTGNFMLMFHDNYNRDHDVRFRHIAGGYGSIPSGDGGNELSNDFAVEHCDGDACGGDPIVVCYGGIATISWSA